jgi:hypothetical protein
MGGVLIFQEQKKPVAAAAGDVLETPGKFWGHIAELKDTPARDEGASLGEDGLQLFQGHGFDAGAHGPRTSVSRSSWGEEEDKDYSGLLRSGNLYVFLE